MSKINTTIAGRYYTNPHGEVYELNSMGNMAYAGGLNGENVTVLLTGNVYTTVRGNDMYQTNTGFYIDITDEGWVWTKSLSKSKTEAQALVNRIIRNNQIILTHNILCARFVDKLSASDKKMLYSLQSRLMNRNEKLQDDGLVQGVQTSYPQGYVYLQDYMTQFMASSGGVGVATWVVVVVAATVLASAATAAYLVYKSFADESDRDVKYSEQLTKILMDKLTPDEYQQLLSETRGVVTKSKIKQSLKSYGSVIQYALIGLGGYFLYKSIKERV